jgi:serine/threonine protein kinase/ABC-type branched-subunit amino acid transport system substrate-binding protein
VKKRSPATVTIEFCYFKEKMSYCINPQCSDRQNSDDASCCRACNTQLALYGGRFQISEKISKPNHSPEWEVFIVTDNRDPDKWKVLKTLTDNEREFKTRFKREIEILKNSKNSGIPAYIIDFTLPAENSRPELHCLVMEWIEGEDLEKWLQTHHKLADEQTALTWLRKIAIALAYLHSKKHFHRDIKPSNIMLKTNGDLALIDFGIVRQMTNTVERYGASTHAYTPIYAAPEQIVGNAVPQSDFYALGKTFIYLLTGQRPIANELDLNRWEYETNFPTSRIIPVINWLLEEDLQERPQTPEKILEAIDYISTRKSDGTLPTSDETSNFIARLKQPQSQSKWYISVLKIAIPVAISSIAGFLVYDRFLKPPTLRTSLLQSPEELISFGDRELHNSYGNNKLDRNESVNKLEGINLLKAGKYQAAYQKFAQLRQTDKKDPDLAIYMNNAKVRYWHQKKPTKPISTIVAAVPAGIEQGQHILFGVAHNQYTVVNPTDSLDREPDLYLEVGIADDLNKPAQAVENAKKLVERTIKGSDNKVRSILAIVGHYSSEVTCAALPTYTEAGVSIISSTSSMSELRKKCGDRNQVFFRTISSSRFESVSLAELLEQKRLRKLIVTPFYKKKDLGYSQDLFEKFKQDFNHEFGRELERGFDLSANNDVKQGINKARTSNIIVLFSDEKTETSKSFNNAIEVIEKADPQQIDLILAANPLLSAELGPDLLQKWHGKLVVAVDWDDEPQCSNQDFVKMGNKFWGGSLNRTTSASYEAVQVLSTLLSKGDRNTRSQLKDDLKNVSNVKSEVFNNKYISFDPNGDRADIRQKILLTPTASGKKLDFKPIDKLQCSL